MMLAITTPEATHMAMELIFSLFLLFVAWLLTYIAIRVNRNANNLSKLVTDNQADRVARDKALVIVKQETLALAKRAEESYGQLHQKLDENTEMTRAAAVASDNAATVANRLNEKIYDTNARLLEQVKGVSQSETKALHDHIEEGVEVSKDIGHKVDELKDKL